MITLAVLSVFKAVVIRFSRCVGSLGFISFRNLLLSLNIVCMNLKESGDSDLGLANRIVGSLGQDVADDVRITGACRLKSNVRDKPGIFKIAFRNLEDKKKVLRSKVKLKDHAEFKNVFLRSSKTHTERLLELNTRTLLKHIPNGDQLRLTSHGKIVPKDVRFDRGTSQGDKRPQDEQENKFALPRPQRTPPRRTTPRKTPARNDLPPPPPPPLGRSPPRWQNTPHSQRTRDERLSNSDDSNFGLERAGDMGGLDNIQMDDPLGERETV